MENIKYSDKLISFNNSAPTAWVSLMILSAISAMFLTYTYASAKEVEYVIEEQEIAFEVETSEAKFEAIEKETDEWFDSREQEKQDFLQDLRACESDGYDYAIGDSGESVGAYQWQKATLEEKLERSLTYDEYYAIVTDFETIHDLTYKTYFDDNERWRWYNCTINIKGTLSW